MTELAIDESSMDEISSQNTKTVETASSNTSNADSVVSASGNVISFCTSDPATWSQLLSSADRESIVHNRPSKNPSSFPHRETVSRDWLVWSQTKNALF